MSDIEVERVARAYCALTGLNADETVSHSAKPTASGWVPDVLYFSPRWMLIADRVRDEEAMRLAVRAGRLTEEP